MRKLRLLLALLFAVSVGLVNAQTKSVSGTVVSAEDGQPIIGASVVAKGTTTGVTTNVNGHFSFSVPSSTITLVVSYVGMNKKEVAIGQNLKIELEPTNKSLDEVLVVAYGKTTRAQFTGSAGVVDGGELIKKSTSNISNALQGEIAGVQVVNGSGQPGTSATIRIRGIGSINGGRTPLYVVDGAPYAFSLNTINPNDIESITVLKDASATSIYGARGANGVVLITTKSGKSGKMSVNVDAKWGTSSRGVSNYNVMTDPAMYYETAYKALYNSQVYNGSSAADAYTYADSKFLSQSGVGYLIYKIPAGERLIGTNFKLNPNAKLGYSDGTYYYTPDNWEKESLTSNNMRQEYNVSLSGGDNKSQYFISSGYLEDKGIIYGSGFKRYTLSGKIDSQIKNWLKVGLSSSYGNTTTNSPSYQSSWGSTGNLFYTMNMMAPIYPFYVRNEDGTIATNSSLGQKVYDQGTSTNFTRPGAAPRGNQAVNLLLDKNSSVRDYFTGNIYAVITPLKGLSITARLSPDVSNTFEHFLSNPFYASQTTEGSVSVTSDRTFTMNQQYLANYAASITDLHKIEVLLGYENYYLTDSYLSGSNDHLYDPFIAELGNAFGTQPTSSNLDSYTDNLSSQGYVGRLQYDFTNRYFFTASMRYEGSSRFAPGKQWGLFGSAGAAWIVSKEKFMLKTSSWLDELKYKISYGTQGNDQLGYYAYRNLYSIAYNSTTSEYTKVLLSAGNEDLTWEAQKLFNTGIEFSLLSNTISGSFDYFSRLNSNMLFNEPQPLSSGYSTITIPKNLGSVLNNGVELNLKANIVKSKNLNWSVFVNATSIHNKIVKMPEYTKTTGGLKYSSSIFKEGGSLNEAYIVQWAGVDKQTGQALYYVDPANGDYSTTSVFADAKQTDLGDIGVKWYGGFGTNLEGYGFDFSCQFAYQLGGKAYDGTYQQLMHSGPQIGENWSLDILNSWTPENTDTDVPRLNASSIDDMDQKPSSRFLVSSDYLSLNNITVGYTLPISLVRKISINNLRVFVSGDNLALFSARQGFDPRQTQNSFATGVAVSTTSGNYVYSQLRVLSGGISVTF